jgi:flagellar hook-associated protein 3 FlgL
MEFRTTTGSRANAAIAQLQTQASASAKWQSQILTAKRLNKPSDGASDFVSLVDLKARELRLGTSLGTIADATNALNEGVNHLTEASQVLTHAHSLALDAANASSDGPAYEAIAVEVDALLSRFTDLANAKVGDRYLFGGTATTTKPFEVTATDGNGRPTAITYQGADERSKGVVGQGQTVDTIYVGNQTFQAGPDAFQTLMTLRDNLRDPSLSQAQRSDLLNQRMAELETARTTVLNTVGEQSSNLESLQALETRVQDVRIGVQARAGELEGADFAEATVKFQEQQNAFQATLAVTSKIFAVSMVDYMN